MTLVARSVVGFVVESVAWLTVVAALSMAVASPVWALRRSRGVVMRSLVWAGSGAILVASLAHRFRAPLGPAGAVGRRDLPLLWLAAGAAAGTLALAIRWRGDSGAGGQS